jgi:hypothetical protein
LSTNPQSHDTSKYTPTVNTPKVSRLGCIDPAQSVRDLVYLKTKQGLDKELKRQLSRSSPKKKKSSSKPIQVRKKSHDSFDSMNTPNERNTHSGTKVSNFDSPKQDQMLKIPLSSAK